MAVVTVTDTGRVLRSPEEVSTFLAQHGIWYRRFEELDQLDADANEEQILAAFDEPIRKLHSEGGYTTADVIDIHADTHAAATSPEGGPGAHQGAVLREGLDSGLQVFDQVI